MATIPMCTPLPARPILENKPETRHADDEQWLNIKAIIAAIAVPRPHTSDSFSQDSTPVNEEETSRQLLPKVVDAAENAYGTFNLNLNANLQSTTTSSDSEEKTILPLHPTTLLTSAALTPIYLILMLLPMLPFWIFAGFLVYVAATEPIIELEITLLALAFLLPFNTIGTVAITRFALNEREKALDAMAEADVESCSPVSRRSSRSGSGSLVSEKRMWRPSMQFVLHGARREGRRV